MNVDEERWARAMLCHAGDGAALRPLVVVLDRLLRDDLELDRGRVPRRDGSLREVRVSAALAHDAAAAAAAGGGGGEGVKGRAEKNRETHLHACAVRLGREPVQARGVVHDEVRGEEPARVESVHDAGGSRRGQYRIVSCRCDGFQEKGLGETHATRNVFA